MPSRSMPPFWQALVKRIMRLAVQVAHSSGHCAYNDLQRLLQAAIFEELSAQGLSGHQIGVTLDCSPRQARTLARIARELEMEITDSGTLPRVLKALTRGPLTTDQIGRLVRQDGEFDVLSLTLKILVARGAISPAGARGTYALTPAWAEAGPARWEQPLQGAEHQRSIALRVLRLLHAAPQTRDQLLAHPQLRDLPPTEVDQALAFLTDEGFLAASISPAPLQLAARAIRVVPEDPSPRLRVGLLDMLDKTGEFLGVALRREGEEHFGQRNLLFRARPEGLRRLVDDHHAWTLPQLERLEEEALSAPDAQQCLMVWMISRARG